MRKKRLKCDVISFTLLSAIEQLKIEITLWNFVHSLLAHSFETCIPVPGKSPQIRFYSQLTEKEELLKLVGEIEKCQESEITNRERPASEERR